MASCARYEPTIDEILADPTVKALMKADRVNPDRLQTKLRSLRRVMVLASADDAGERRPLPERPMRAAGDGGMRQLWG